MSGRSQDAASKRGTTAARAGKARASIAKPPVASERRPRSLSKERVIDCILGLCAAVAKVRLGIETRHTAHTYGLHFSDENEVLASPFEAAKLRHCAGKRGNDWMRTIFEGQEVTAAIDIRVKNNISVSIDPRSMLQKPENCGVPSGTRGVVDQVEDTKILVMFYPDTANMRALWFNKNVLAMLLKMTQSFYRRS